MLWPWLFLYGEDSWFYKKRGHVATLWPTAIGLMWFAWRGHRNQGGKGRMGRCAPNMDQCMYPVTLHSINKFFL